MNFLDPIYNNNSGTAYAIRSSMCDDDAYTKIQLQLGDIAILMDFNEVKSFLKIIKSAKKRCSCPNCVKDGRYKVIKCDTAYAEIKLKVTPVIMRDLEELVKGILFESQMSQLLNDNNIV